MADDQTDDLAAAKEARDAREGGDSRSDLEQAVGARADAVACGEGGAEPDPMTETGDYSGNAGTGGEVKNQDTDAQ